MTSTTVTAVDPVDRLVQLDGGGSLGYERLLLATGASPRPLDVPGGHLPGVLSLRTVDDADVLREGILRAERVVVVGSGWIGCEVAACARMLGAEVAMVSPDPYPLLSVLGPQVAAVLAGPPRRSRCRAAPGLQRRGCRGDRQGAGGAHHGRDDGRR